MKHIYENTGQEFEVGRLFDFDGKTYDINVITKWDIENDFDQSPIIIDYYFGEPEKDTTDSFIEQFLKQQESLKKAVKYLEDKYVVDHDFMTKAEQTDLTETIKSLRQMITDLV